MSETTGRGDADRLVDRLADADEAYREAVAAVEEVGEDRIERVREAHDEATSLLNRYEDRATGTGDFQSFVQFQQAFTEFVESLDEELPRYERFEEADDILDKRRLSEDDFERVRRTLVPARDLAGRLDERKRARERYRDARRAILDRVRTIGDEIDRLERTRELGAADLEAPTGRLRDPIEAYDDAVREAFRSYRRETTAREVLAFVLDTREFPLVEFDRPPEELLAYVREHDAGTEPIPTLLEYADYSRSKLSHYVDDPAELKRRIATRRTYLERLDGEPLTVGWPPPAAGELEFLARELVSVCARFAPDEVVERARTVRALPHETDYERLRDAAVAEARLDEKQRERLAAGAVEDDLQALRAERETLEEVLAEYPER